MVQQGHEQQYCGGQSQRRMYQREQDTGDRQGNGQWTEENQEQDLADAPHGHPGHVDQVVEIVE